MISSLQAVKSVKSVKLVKLVSLVFVFLFSFTFVIAVGIDNPYLPIVKPENVNYTTIESINNSEYFDGYTVASLWSYYSGLGNNLWCELTGCEMTGDINMSGNDINNAGTITADYFIGNGSGLTGVASTGDTTNSSFHIYINGSAYNNVNYNITAGDVADVTYPIEPGKKFIYGDTYT